MSASRTIAYQGFLSSESGTPLGGELVLTFRIYRDALGSERLWTERHEAVPVRAGLFLVALGSVEPLENVPELFESGRTLYVSIEVGEDGEMTPRLPLGAVPYSLAAGTSPLRSATTVDCTSGETIADALRQAPAGGEYTINVIGTCVENVQIERNLLRIAGIGDAKIVGVTPNLHPANAVVYVDGARAVQLEGKITIQGAPGDTTGMAGIVASDGASASITKEVVVQKVDGPGIHVVDNSSFDVRGKVLDSKSHGVFLEGNSHADLQDAVVDVSRGGIGVYLRKHSSATFIRSTVRSSGYCGVALDDGSTLVLDEDNLLEANVSGDVCATLFVYRGSAVRAIGANTIIRSTLPASFVDNVYSQEAGGMALDVAHKSNFRSFNIPVTLEGWITSSSLSINDLRRVTINGHVYAGGGTANLRLRDQSGIPDRVTLNGSILVRGTLSIRTNNQAAIINGDVNCGGGFGVSTSIRFKDPEDGYIDCANISSDISVSLADDVDPVQIGETVTYTAQIVNERLTPAVEALNVGAGFTLSGASLTILAADGPNGPCNINGAGVVCFVGNLRTGSPATITVQVRRDGAGQMVNDVNVTLRNNDLDGADNTASETTD